MERHLGLQFTRLSMEEAALGMVFPGDSTSVLMLRHYRGATPRLTAEQQAHIPVMLVKGASTYGLCREVWKSRRLAVAIKREGGVNCHPTQRRNG